MRHPRGHVEEGRVQPHLVELMPELGRDGGCHERLAPTQCDLSQHAPARSEVHERLWQVAVETLDVFGTPRPDPRNVQRHRSRRDRGSDLGGGVGLLIVLGVLSVLFGILVFNNFLAGMVTLASLFVAYMVVGGILAILLGFRIKALGDRLGLLTS